MRKIIRTRLKNSIKSTFDNRECSVLLVKNIAKFKVQAVI